jgi:hypothetical protein
MNYLSPNVFSDVFTALQPLFQELAKTKKLGSKKDSARVHIANILRCCSQSLVSSSFESRDNLLQSFLNYILDSYNFLLPHADSQANSVNWTIFSLKYSLFCTLHHVILRSFKTNQRLHDTMFRTDYRRDLFTFISKFVGVGQAGRSQKQLELKQTEEICSKMKTVEEKNTFKSKTANAILIVEKAAAEAMHSLLLGKGFDSNVFDASGMVFDWVTSLFHTQISAMHDLGRSSVIDLTQSNSRNSSVIPLLIEKSYLSDKPVSYNYFLCLAEIVTSFDVEYSVHSILLVILYKLGDIRLDVRRAAFKLLFFLCEKHFVSSGGYTYYVAPEADIDASFTSNVVSLSMRLANDRPELTFLLLDEVMFRIPTLEPSGQKRLFSYYSHWAVNIDLRSSSQDRINACLRHLFVLTLKLGQDRSDAEKMWTLLAQKESNIAPILNFLFEFAVIAQSRDSLPFCKQIILYLSRASPRATVAHLVTELRSLDVRSLGLEKVTRGGISNPLSWELMEIFPPMTYQEPFSRSHFSITLLANIAIEHGMECAKFLPRVLHAIFLAGDRRNELITSNSLYLFYNLIIYLISGHSRYREILKSVSEKLDVLRNSPSFWTFEDISREKLELKSFQTLSEFVVFVIETLSWKNTLVQEWGAESLDLAMTTDNHHILARCLQIYRSLKPHISRDDLFRILTRFKSYIQKKEPLGTGLEIIYTLQEAVKWTDKSDLEKMPQFFWVSIGLLNSNDAIEYNAGVSLLSTTLNCIEFGSPVTQKYLLDSFPYEGWSPPFVGFLPLLVKGMTNKKTEKLTLALLSDTALLPHGPVIDIDPKRRLLLNTIVLLPHLCHYMGKEGTTDMAKGLSCMFDYSASAYLDNSSNYAEIFQKYSTNDYETMEGFVDSVASETAVSFFPQYELLVFSYLIEVFDRGNPEYKQVLLVLLNSFLSHIKIDQSSLQTRGMALFSSIEQCLIGQNSELSLTILKKVMCCLPPNQIQIAHAKHMNVIQRLGDFCEFSSTWEDELSTKSYESLLAMMSNILEFFEKPESYFESGEEEEQQQQQHEFIVPEERPRKARSGAARSLNDSPPNLTVKKSPRTAPPSQYGTERGSSMPNQQTSAPGGSTSKSSRYATNFRRIPSFHPPEPPAATISVPTAPPSFEVFDDQDLAICFPDLGKSFFIYLLLVLNFQFCSNTLFISTIVSGSFLFRFQKN